MEVIEVIFTLSLLFLAWFIPAYTLLYLLPSTYSENSPDSEEPTATDDRDGWKEEMKNDELLMEDLPPPCDVKMCTVWNLEKLQDDLDRHVVGQDHAVRTIKKIMKQASKIPLSKSSHESEKPKHHFVFLVGGPGVGKNFIIRLISQCLKLQELTRYKLHEPKFISHESYRNYGDRYLRSVLTVPENHENIFGAILSNLHLDILPLLSSDNKHDVFDCRTFLSISLSCLKRPGILFKPIHFVTGKCIPDITLKQFKRSKEYEEYINEFAEKLCRNMEKYLPHYDYTIVKFKPLTMESVRMALPRDKLSSLTPIPSSQIREDFVPHGCKLLLQKNDDSSASSTQQNPCKIV